MAEAKAIVADIHPLRAEAVRALAAHPNGREWHDWTDEVKERTQNIKVPEGGVGWIKIARDPLFEWVPIADREYWYLSPLGREVYALLSVSATSLEDEDQTTGSK